MKLNMLRLPQALNNLSPTSKWIMRGDEYSGIEWLEDTEYHPTEQELVAEINRLQALYDSLEYQRQRAAAYPSFADQFDLLYHGGYDAWKAEIDAIKEQYPKP